MRDGERQGDFMMLDRTLHSSSALFSAVLLGAFAIGCQSGEETVVAHTQAAESRSMREPDAGCGATQTLGDALDVARAAAGATGATLAVLDATGCRYVAASGIADTATGRRMVTDDRFRIASITKTFVATVVLQLMEEGRLTLDDSLAKWVAFPGADAIHLRQLLNHTSGVFDFTNDPAWLAGRAKPWTAGDLVALAANEPRLFSPGTDWSYSNTNYVLLGMTIEAVIHEPWDTAVRTRLLEPLGLTSTRVGTDADASEIARGYQAGQDVTAVSTPSSGGAAGAMVSTALDISTFARALFHGALLQPSTLAMMVKPTALPDGRVAAYGLGLEVAATPYGFDFGHGGDIDGFKTRFGYLPDRDAIFVVLVNDYLPYVARTLEQAAWAAYFPHH
jgi:D-alanyl-D-alanine carboxypeptidase